MWIGPKGTIQTFHQDNHDDVVVNSNLFMQMAGSKYAAVALDVDSTIFEANSILTGYRRHSSVSPFDPDLREAAPTLSHAVLFPGDILFIPPRAWHYFQSLLSMIGVAIEEMLGLDRA
jgi:hypothetical protein